MSRTRYRHDYGVALGPRAARDTLAGPRAALHCLAFAIALTLPAALLAPARSWAQSAAHSTVSPADALGNVIMCPADPSPIPASVVTVTVRSAPGVVMPFTPVWLVLSSPNVTLCSAQVLSGVTDAVGVCTFVMAGGGYGGTPTDIEIWAGPGAGVQLRTFPVRSPDFDGAGGNLIVNLADLQLFALQLSGTGGTSHDYGPPVGVDLGDLIIFAAAFLLPSRCN